MQPLELADRPAELVALLGERRRRLERALRQAERHRRGTDALAVVGVHQVGEAVQPTFRRLQHHLVRHFQVLEADLRLRNAAQSHRRLALADHQPLRLVAHREEPADAARRPVSSNTRAKIRCSLDTPPPVIQCLRPLSSQ